MIKPDKSGTRIIFLFGDIKMREKIVNKNNQLFIQGENMR
jgi:CRISPR/Cas system-associated protein endoribonuclease Cas2